MTPVKKKRAAETVLTHGGRHPHTQHGFVNTPVVRGSTVVFETLDELETPTKPYRYGRHGNPTTDAVAEIITELEGAAGTVLTPSGLSGIAIALLACLENGDDVLVTDSAYEPTRHFCNDMLSRNGVSARYYDPRIGAGIAQLIRPNTRAIFMESPGSLTFEIQDLPAVRAAAGKDIAIIFDNSWATPLFHNPLSLGADIVVHTGTKMFVGHSDAILGTVSATAARLEAVQRTSRGHGVNVSPDDAWLAARGLRTLGVRMKEHQSRALELARWLEARGDVVRVLHPGLPTHPDHRLFARDFRGSGSLFGFVLPPARRAAIAAMMDGMELYAMGYSWGGFESLMLPIDPRKARTAVPWTEKGNLFRLHAGFEDMGELKADLEAGLKRYRAAS
ncbi:MAG: cystathionine beta-lyase [Cucumibacter sp.]